MTLLRTLTISVLILICPPLAIASQASLPAAIESNPDAILDALHQYASTAEWDKYFDLYLKQGIFIGTDENEYWDKKSFSNYARPTQGWHYTVKQRKQVRHDNFIVFDEILYSKAYGKCRGTGTLILTKNGWKIAQYHLSFPIPNEMAKSITQTIKSNQDSK